MEPEAFRVLRKATVPEELLDGGGFGLVEELCQVCPLEGCLCRSVTRYQVQSC
jgi:hypothetical protein